MEVIAKVCTKCGVEKELTEFHKEKSKKYGVRNQCKTCVCKRMMEYYANPEVKVKINKRMREYRANPEAKAKAKEHQRKYRSNPEVKVKINKRRAKPEAKIKNRKLIKRLVAEIAPFYAKTLLVVQSGGILKRSEIPESLIDLKRQSLTLKRQLKQKTQCQ